MNSGPETGLNARKFGFKARTKYGVYNGTRREVTGEIEIEVQIGPCTFNMEFQVMDISPSYNCLLGRPWIHIAEAVLS